MDLLPSLGIHMDILLTVGEESGMSTASMFRTKKKYNWVVEFDRAGVDTVIYDFKEWTATIEKYFKLGHGTFSDISSLNIGCCALNIGVGYHNQHTSGCLAYLDEYKPQIERFVKFYNENKDIHYPHTPVPKNDFKGMFKGCEFSNFKSNNYPYGFSKGQTFQLPDHPIGKCSECWTPLVCMDGIYYCPSCDVSQYQVQNTREKTSVSCIGCTDNCSYCVENYIGGGNYVDTDYDPKDLDSGICPFCGGDLAVEIIGNGEYAKEYIECDVCHTVF
jgi:hypothetical protein